MYTQGIPQVPVQAPFAQTTYGYGVNMQATGGVGGGCGCHYKSAPNHVCTYYTCSPYGCNGRCQAMQQMVNMPAVSQMPVTAVIEASPSPPPSPPASPPVDTDEEVEVLSTHAPTEKKLPVGVCSVDLAVWGYSSTPLPSLPYLTGAEGGNLSVPKMKSNHRKGITNGKCTRCKKLVSPGMTLCPCLGKDGSSVSSYTPSSTPSSALSSLDTHSRIEEAPVDMVHGLLGRMTGPRYQESLARIQRMLCGGEVTVGELVDAVVEKVGFGSCFIEQYSRLCLDMSGFTAEGQGIVESPFRKLLLKRCQQEFQKMLASAGAGTEGRALDTSLMTFVATLHSNTVLGTQTLYTCVAKLLQVAKKSIDEGDASPVSVDHILTLVRHTRLSKLASPAFQNAFDELHSLGPFLCPRLRSSVATFTEDFKCMLS